MVKKRSTKLNPTNFGPTIRSPKAPFTLDLLHIKLTQMEFLTDLWMFLRERKKYWLTPIILTLLLLGLLLVMGGGTAVAPFVYTLF